MTARQPRKATAKDNPHRLRDQGCPGYPRSYHGIIPEVQWTPRIELKVTLSKVCETNSTTFPKSDQLPSLTPVTPVVALDKLRKPFHIITPANRMQTISGHNRNSKFGKTNNSPHYNNKFVENCSISHLSPSKNKKFVEKSRKFPFIVFL